MAYQSEIEKLEQRYEEHPKQWFAALADAHRKAGKLDLALEYVRGGLEMRPDYASAHIVLGRCLLDKRDDVEAAEAFERVLQLDAENIIALRSLSEIAERCSDLAAARGWLARLLEVDPMNDEAQTMLDRLTALEVEETAAAASTEVVQESGADPTAELAPAWAAEVTPTVRSVEETVQEADQSVHPDEAAALEETDAVGQLEESPAPALGAEAEQDEFVIERLLEQEEAAILEATLGSPSVELETHVAAAELGEDHVQETAPGGAGPAPEQVEVVSFAEELDWGAGDARSEGHLGHSDAGPGVPGVVEPEPVVTETMAEVFAHQGLFSEARRVYRELLRQRPGDAALQSRLDELPVDERAAADASETPPSRFSVKEMGGQSAVAFLREIFSGASVRAESSAAGTVPSATDVGSAPPPGKSSVGEGGVSSGESLGAEGDKSSDDDFRHWLEGLEP